MSDNMNVLLVGAGNMAKAYCKVLLAMGHRPIVIGRGDANASAFEKELGVPVIRGGIDIGLRQVSIVPEYAINATTVTDLSRSTISLIEAGIKNVLVEKPGGVDYAQIKAVADSAASADANIYVAYNRRFYASVDKAKSFIEADGGVTSFNFEFTEWGHVVEKAAERYDQKTKEAWFVLNSTHVVDLAFFLGGEPREMTCYTAGELPWHRTGCIYAGAGVTVGNVPFSYQANWAAPGRWGVEVLTRKHRLYLRPMEKLFVQELNSVAVNPVDLDDSLDIAYKPGLYRQVEAFLTNAAENTKISIHEQLRHMKTYARIENKWTKIMQ